MNARTQATLRTERRGRGLTVAEALVLVGALVLLAALLLPVLTTPTSHINYTRCKSRLGQLYKGVRMYLNDFDEFFPAAWHVAGEPRPDLSNVSYHRFGVHEHANSSFSHVVQSGQTPAATTAGKFKETRRYWECPGQGWTSDYFAPELVFRMPSADGRAQHAQYNSLVADLSSTERPVLTGVDASYAQGAGAYPDEEYKSPEHKRDVEQGWQTTRCLGTEVFLGVGPSLRKPGDPASTRFDFRHNGRCNMIFLDSHVVSVGETEHKKLRAIYDAWNHLAPRAGRKERP